MKKIMLTILAVVFTANIMIAPAQAATYRENVMTIMGSLAYFSAKCSAYGSITNAGYIFVTDAADRFGKNVFVNDPTVKLWFANWNKYLPSQACPAILKALPNYTSR